MGAFGLVLLMALTSVAVVGYFRRHRNWYGPWTRIVAPTLAAAALIVLLGMIALNFDVLIGLEEPGVLAWLLPAITLAAGALGTAWAGWIARTRPDVYAGIGRGGEPDGAAPARIPTAPTTTVRTARRPTAARARPPTPSPCPEHLRHPWPSRHPPKPH